jgi:putative hemolysin
VVAVISVVGLLTYLTLELGELVPKQIALHKSERIAVMIAPPMSRLARIASPLVAILNASSSVVLRILGQGPTDEPAVTEEDVRIMLKQGAEIGVFEPMEEEIVGQVFRLADLEAGDLITPRTEMLWIDETDPPEIVREKVVTSGHSRLPVGKENLDKITGIVLAKDLLAQCMQGEPIDIAAIMQPALFVPERTPALSIVERFKETHSKIAIVIDEYGGVEGLVTVDDVMEALVGDFPEPEESEEQGVTLREDGSWLVDGPLLLEDLVEAIDLPQLPENAEHFRTAGGLVMALLGRLPITGDRVQWEDYWVEVVDMDGRRVDKILLTLTEPEERDQRGT